jgi:hypothetical protein
MSLFARKKAKPAPGALASAGAVPPVDNLVGDPVALRLRDALKEGRWQETHDFLESTRDPRLRSFYVNALADVPGWPGWINEWVAQRPTSSVPQLFAGWQRINWAWQARGGGVASTVKQDAWPMFQTRLVQADKDLAKAAALDETDPTPVARSIWIAMGLSLGQAEVRRRFAATEQREHLNQGACHAMVQATAEKWGGSHEAMFEFARWVSREAAEGSPVHKFVALAHLEVCLDLPAGEDAAYILRPDVQAEIRAAAARSIWSDRYPADPATWQDRNQFALCFSLMGDHKAVLDQMNLIGTRITPAPWVYANSAQPGKAYMAAMSRARAAVASARLP